MIQSRKIRYFLAAAEHLHFSSAAASLHISQPALSRSIRQLEERLGLILFERSPKGIVLTRYGELLARRARQMQLDVEHTLAELEGIKTGSGGTLHIGAAPVWLRVFLPPLIERMQREFSNLSVDLMAGTADTLLPALLHGKVDVLCTDLNFPTHPELDTLHLVDLDFAVIAGKDHPLARKDKVEAAELLQYPWISLRGNYSGMTRLGSYFAAQNLAPPVARVVVSPGVGNFGFLTIGNYLTTIPTEMLELADRYDCVRLNLSTKFWQEAAGLVYRNAHPPEASVSAFISIVRERFDK